MASINQYPTKETIDGSELLVCFDVTNSDTRKFSVAALNTFIQGNVDANMSGYVTQYSAPSATAFSVAITNTTKDTHLILTPTGTFAAGTIVLPASSSTADGQRVMVNCTQTVTALTIDGNGATAVTGEPTTISTYGYFTLKYDKPTSTWYRVG